MKVSTGSRTLPGRGSVEMEADAVKNEVQSREDGAKIVRTTKCVGFTKFTYSQIGPYSLTRVKITPKVLIIFYYDQIMLC